MHILSILCAVLIFSLVQAIEEPVFHRFEYEFKVLEKLVDYGKSITLLNTQLQDARQIIADLISTQNSQSSDKNGAATYTRWGRSSCPENSTLVYDGLAAGSMYTATGAAANYLCLPKDPDWPDHTKLSSGYAFIYGAEYQTNDGILNKLYEHDVPCAVCRIPRNNVIMVPGKNNCYQNYHHEYNGYLMSGHPTHAAASEYVCLDKEAEMAQNSSAYNHNGKLFYFVRAKCGSLKCPPYSEGKELTCVVCSFSP